MISSAMVGIAFFLHASPRYRRIKKFFYNLLENSAYPYKKFFDYTMITLIIVSVLILIRQVKHDVNSELLFFNNYIISLIFLAEYLLRMWVYSDISDIVIEQYEHDLFLQRPFRLGEAYRKIISKKSEYLFSPAALIDLMAIMPFFHELRMLRVFILFRVFKLFRYTKSLTQFISILSSKKFEIFTLGMFASVIIAVSSILIYIMEANNPASPINTLFDSLYWSVVTIFTVGYGDMVPVTTEGRTVAMAIIVAGIAVISFATSIVVSAFTEKLDEIKEDKLIENVSKMDSFYLICGYSPLSEQVVWQFKKKGAKTLILEADPEKVAQAQKEGFAALALNPSSLHSYQQLQIDWERQVQGAILLHESDVLNVYTALTIRELSVTIKLLSILHQQENRRKLSLAGIDEIVYTQQLVALMSKEVSGRPVAFEVIHALRSENSGVLIEEITLDSYTKNHLFNTAEMVLFERRLILLGIYKTLQKKFLFNPMQTIRIDSGDVAIVIGTKALIDEFKAILHKNAKGKR
ncbi:ion transporter [Sulfuricurvum sp.]|uniref:ion transporter n=1 Tax=Sulfuricurvum sp. TaxID=2025608 RepID=UPI003BB69E07